MTAWWFVALVLSISSLSVHAAATELTSCTELAADYQPQGTPAATFKLELTLMSQGIYCHDLPIFDPAWRRRGSTVDRSPQYLETAKKFDLPFRTRLSGKRAVLYFPRNNETGPVFLYRTEAGWVLDRTAVWAHIHYDGKGWLAYDGEYPYLALLKQVFRLQPGTARGGRAAFRPAE